MTDKELRASRPRAIPPPPMQALTLLGAVTRTSGQPTKPGRRPRQGQPNLFKHFPQLSDPGVCGRGRKTANSARRLRPTSPPAARTTVTPWPEARGPWPVAREWDHRSRTPPLLHLPQLRHLQATQELSRRGLADEPPRNRRSATLFGRGLNARLRANYYDRPTVVHPRVNTPRARTSSLTSWRGSPTATAQRVDHSVTKVNPQPHPVDRGEQ